MQFPNHPLSQFSGIAQASGQLPSSVQARIRAWGGAGFLLRLACLSITTDNLGREAMRKPTKAGMCGPGAGGERRLRASGRRTQVRRTRGRRLLGHVQVTGRVAGGTRLVEAGVSTPGLLRTPTGTHTGPQLNVPQLPRAPHLPPPLRLPPLRGALPFRARGMPGIGRGGARGQGPGGRGLQTSESPANALS